MTDPTGLSKDIVADLEKADKKADLLAALRGSSLTKFLMTLGYYTTNRARRNKGSFSKPTPETAEESDYKFEIMEAADIANDIAKLAAKNQAAKPEKSGYREHLKHKPAESHAKAAQEHRKNVESTLIHF